MYKDSVLPVLRNSRELLLSEWGTSSIWEKKSEHPADIVTRIDKEVETKVSSELRKLFPEISFVGEEFGGDRKAEKFWLMDPIDGTGHYLRGLPFCTTMLALIENGEVVFSAIYDFINDEIYWAEKGIGAFKNDERIRVSNRSLKEAYIGVEINQSKDSNMQIYHKLRSQSAIVRTICSGWEHAMIAAGKLDARIMYEPFGKDYDYAPGSLLVREAGGIVANIFSTTYDYRNLNVIVANPVIYKELTEGSGALFPNS